MRYIWCCVPGLLLALAVSTPLRAQTIDSPYRYVETRNSVSVFAGHLEVEEGALGMAPTPATQFGARYTRHLTGPLLGEVGFGLASSRRTAFSRETASGPLLPIGETDLLMMVGEAGLRFSLTGPRTWRGIAPYVMATAGFVADLTSGDEFESDVPPDQLFRFGPGFAVAGGFGSEFYLTERFSLRAEARDHLWRLSYPGGVSGTGQREDEWVHNFGFTLGGAIHF